MPIYRLFKDWAFEPEQCRVMALAYEDVLADLGLDRVDPSCELVAMKIIELAKQGVGDQQQLRALALAALAMHSKKSAV